MAGGSAVDWACRTLLVLSIAVLDGRCFIVRDNPQQYSPGHGPTAISSSSNHRDVAPEVATDDAKSYNHHRKSTRHHHRHAGKGVASTGVTCEYNGKVYPPGEYQISPCVTCVCEKSGELRCTSETCPPEPGCIEYDRVPGQCCAQCLEYGCLHNGTGYPRGSNIPAGPCTKCYCPWGEGRNSGGAAGGSSTGDPGAAVCMDFHCPPVKCVDATVPRGHCCPFCPNGENCWLDDLVIPAGQDVWVDKCRSCYCPDGAEAEGAVTSSSSKTNAITTSSSRKSSKPTSSESRRRQGYERRALCYRHSGCIEW